MAIKSLISSSRQIRANVSQTDVNLGADNASRNTLVNGATYLEEDMNNMRSMILDITGETLWSDIPAVTLADAAGASTKLIIQPVQYSGGIVVATSATSIVTALNAVAGVANTTATTDLGYVVSDVLLPVEGSKAHVSVRDAVTNAPIFDALERKVFAVARNNGADLIQLDFFIRDNTGTAVAYSFPADQTIEAILPSRTTLATADESFPMVNAGWADAVGSFEIGDREWVDGLLNDGVTATYGFVANEDLTTTINKLAAVGILDKNLGDNVSNVSGITSNTFTTTFLTDNTNSYLADGDTLIQAIEKLDAQALLNEQAAANASDDKVIAVIPSAIAEAVAVTLPSAKTYLNTDKDALTVYVNGQQLISDAVADAFNTGDLGDYAETSTTEVTFNFPLETGDVITYVISKP